VSSISAQQVYERLGWSIIPVDSTDKHPLVQWRNYTSKRADSFETAEWGRRFPNAGIAVICGKVSGLLVLDADGPLGTQEAIERGLPDSPMAETPSGGRHVYFRSVDGVSFRNGAKLGESKKIDVRSDAGYVIAPPSKRLDGRRYRWLKHPDQTRLADPPEWFMKLLVSQRAANQPLRAPLSNSKHDRQGNTDGGDGSGLFGWINQLPVFAQKLVLEGHDLERYPSRSECDLDVVQRLLCIGAPLEIVEEVFSTYAIGEKYNESGEGSRYLEKTVIAAMRSVKEVKVKYADIREYESGGKRLHLALLDENGLIRTGLTVPDGRLDILVRWNALFNACNVQVTDDLETMCRGLVGKRLRILFSYKRENPVVGFYHI
jgi:hypothetical protein